MKANFKGRQISKDTLEVDAKQMFNLVTMFDKGKSLLLNQSIWRAQDKSPAVFKVVWSTNAAPTAGKLTPLSNSLSLSLP